MNEQAKKQVLDMIAKAAREHSSVDALHWTQAATNAANALACMAGMEIQLKQAQ